MCSIAYDMRIFIKTVGKDSHVVVSDREDYNAKAGKRDKNVYKKSNFKRKILQGLAELSNVIFKCLKRKVKITEKELKHFTMNYERLPT